MVQKKKAQTKSAKSKAAANQKVVRSAGVAKSAASRKSASATATKKKAPAKAKVAKTKKPAVKKAAAKTSKSKVAKSVGPKKTASAKTAATKVAKKVAPKAATEAAKSKSVKAKEANVAKVAKTKVAKVARGGRRGKLDPRAARTGESKVAARVVVGASNKTKLASKKLGASRKAAMVAASKASATAAAARAVAASVARSSAGKKTAAATLTGGGELGTGPRQNVSQRHGFKKNEAIVYPSHGVGQIVGIEEQEIAGIALELFVIHFEKEKLTLRVPTGKLESVGMRKLSDESLIAKAMRVLKGRARIKRTMWSRRAQEYIAKINSGDLISIAEVVRDLYRSDAQPEQSYSERQLYEDALDRMAREVAAVERIDERSAVQRITDVLSKSARSRRAAEAESSADGDADDSRAA